MSDALKNQSEILSKLGIEQLNPMQKAAKSAFHTSKELVLLSPTGTGKTLAFLLPLVAELDPNKEVVQVVIITPSRELAIQIEQVVRDMGAGYKTNAVYGGRPISKDKLDLKTPPAILIGTPGRIADHLRRGTVSVADVSILILDEFDKSLEVGFEEEMSEIVEGLPNLNKKVLTSATHHLEVPAFVGLNQPLTLDYLDQGVQQLVLKKVISPTKDKLPTLGKLLRHLGNEPGIVFCNFKDSIQRVSDYLNDLGIAHGCFYGGLDQIDRERALIKFRNGTHQLIIATDLAARGLDIPEIKFIVHYHLPLKEAEFTHRNGRTARMNADGTAYVLQWEEETLPEFISDLQEEQVEEAPTPAPSAWVTLFVSGGRKDKISKGDIAGLFFKQGKLKKEELGVIELKQDCAFVAVHKNKVNQLLKMVDNVRLKKKKVKVSLVNS